MNHLSSRRKKTNLFIFVFALITGLFHIAAIGANEEWVTQRTVSYDIDVFRDISFLQDDRTGWVIGHIHYGRIHSGAALLKTIDTGQTWTEYELGISNVIEAIHFIDEQDGWVVGSRGTIASSSDGGTSWTPQVSGTEARLRDVAFVNESNGWAVGDNTILYTVNGGELWQGAGTHYTARFSAVTFPTKGSGWIVGSDGAIYSYTADDGGKWNPIESPTTEDLSDIHFVDSTMAWIVGKNGTILHSEDAGTTWTIQSSNTTRWLNGVFFIDKDVGWAVGFGGTVLYTENGGQTWDQKPVKASATLNMVHFFDQGYGWICGAGGVFFHTPDSGNTWNCVMNGPNANLTDVVFIDSKNGWACGWNGTVLHTHDGGEVWTPQRAEVDALLMGIDFIDLIHGWLVAFEGGMRKTDDGGNSWLPVSPPAGTFRGLDYVDIDNAWVVGEHSSLGAIYHSRDNGTDWQVAARVSIGGPLYDIHFVDTLCGWAVGAGGTILHTTDGGNVWDIQNSNVEVELTHIRAIDCATAWVAGNLNGLLRTTDSGTTWTLIELHPNYTYGPIAFPSTHHGWVVGHSKTDGSVVVLHTSDGGNNWHTTQMSSKEGFTAMDFIGPLEGWTVGEKGTVRYYTNLPFHMISGQTVYCDNLNPIQGNTIYLSGYTADTVLTDEEGTFQFDGLRQGRRYCLEPHISGAPQQVITSFDASLILSSLVGKYFFDSCDSIAADVTTNNEITVYDASNILRYVVGLDAEGLTGTWTFLPETVCFQDLQSDQSDTLQGIIYGDVSQNWPGIPGAGVPEVIVMIPPAGAAAGTEFRSILFSSSLTSTPLDSLNIYSYQTQIYYDPHILQVITVSDSGLFAEGQGLLSFSIDKTNGHLHIAKASRSPFPWSGPSSAPLVRIHFRVNSTAPSGATSPLTIVSWIFNEGIPWAKTQDGFFQVLKHTISGTISYCSTKVAVPEVLLSIVGDTSYTTSSDAIGWYIFNNLSKNEDYCITSLSKSDVPDHVITSYDASLILRYMASTCDFGHCARGAADVNNDGTIDRDDALIISQFVTRDRNAGRAGTWSFAPPDTCYDNLPSDQIDQNYEAFLHGDVSVNYPGRAVPSESPWLLVTIPDDSVEPGATFGLHVVIDTFSTDDLDALNIYACDLRLRYDPSFLTPLLVSTEGLTTESWGTTTSYIDELSGLVTIGMASAHILTQIQTTNVPLARVEFYVKKETPIGTSTPIYISDALFNEGSPKADRKSGQLYIQGKRISGTVRYCDTPRAVEGVTLQIFSLTTERATTDSKGNYAFSDLPPGGRYCIFPLRGKPLTPDQHVISSWDAARIFQHIVDLLTFSPCDSIAADVSGDGNITAYDASIILRYVACEGCSESLLPPGKTGTWSFEPQHRCFENLTYNQISDFNTILYGDVSQNWSGIYHPKKVAVTGVHIGQAKTTPRPKNSFTLPLRVENPSGIIAVDIKLSYNPNDLTAVRAFTTSLTSHWEIAYHTNEDGSMKIAMAGSREPIGSGPFVVIEFEADPDIGSEASYLVEISVLFNEGQIPSPPPIQHSLKPWSSIPSTCELYQNYPNPFNPTTCIRFSIPGGILLSADNTPHITLKVFNLLGQEIRTLAEEPKEPGLHTVTWDGKNDSGRPVASGIYFYQLAVENRTANTESESSARTWSETKRMLLLK